LPGFPESTVTLPESPVTLPGIVCSALDFLNFIWHQPRLFLLGGEDAKKEKSNA
jgi:hypothetical protein